MVLIMQEEPWSACSVQMISGSWMTTWHNFLLWRCGSSGHAVKNQWFWGAKERVQKSGKNTLWCWQECARTLPTGRVWQVSLPRPQHQRHFQLIFGWFLILPWNKLNSVAWGVKGKAGEVLPNEQCQEHFCGLTSWEFWVLREEKMQATSC